MSLKFDLIHGLVLNEKALKRVELRAPNAGDVIDAQEESEKLVYAMINGSLAPTLVTSPSLVGINVLRRQVRLLDEPNLILELSLLKKLHIDDLELIQAKAGELDQALASRAAAREVTDRGRDDGGGGGS